MRLIRIYVEGGKGGKGTDGPLREGFRMFLHEVDAQKRLQVITCGSRNEAYDKFVNAVEKYKDDISVLLVDAEDLVVAPTAKAHLSNREQHWKLSACQDDQCHMMVQAMEAWFVADPDGLEQFYGQGFRRNALPQNPDVEAIPKSDLFSGLKRASRDTTKGEYDKSLSLCGGILRNIDPAKARSKSKHCERLFATLLTLS